MIQLTPIVKNLVLLNVVIFIAMLLLPSQFNYVYNDYFSLHKSAASLVRPTVLIDGVPYFFPTRLELPEGLKLTDGTVISASEAQAILDTSPGLRAEFVQKLAPLRADEFKPLQIITHFFSHSRTSFFHIIFNMFVLASFGPILERVMGEKRFLAFYLFCGLVGGLLMAFLDPSISPVVGASGAIFGVMVAFAMYFPKTKLSFMFIPIGFEARHLVPFFGLVSLVFVVLQYAGINAGGPISHFGHLSGMIAAILFFYVEKYLPLGLKQR